MVGCKCFYELTSKGKWLIITLGKGGIFTEYRLIRSSRKTLAVEIPPTGEVIVRAPRFLSQKAIDRFVEEKAPWITEHIQKQKSRPPRIADTVLSKEEEIRLRETAKTVLPQRVEYYASLMGVKPAGLTVTSAQKRFGSCSGKNRLCFSFRLMLYPPEAVDYVVVHELAHIKEHNHSKAFYAIIEQVLPDYRQREKLLRQ